MTLNVSNLAGTAQLTFSYNFTSLSLWNGTTGVWDTTYPFDDGTNGGSLSGNGEQEWYINYTDAATSSITPWTISNGVLNLTAAPAPASIQPLIDGYQYTSGQLNTYHSFSQEYGYFEIDAKLPAGQGLWPAFWLLPENGSWPPEIDAMEMLGSNTSTYYTTIHYNSDNESQSSAITPGVNLSTSFNVYGVDWEPNYITFYFNGQEVYQVPTPADMNSPMYMLIDLALGGSWAGAVNSTTPFPATMQVAWVKVYQSDSTTTSSSGGTSTVGSGTTVGSPGSTVSSTGTTLTAPNNNGNTLTAGSGDYTLVASYGPDVLVGGSGPDIFDFPVIPWSAGKVENFVPGTDELDFAALFSAAGYTGSNPIADGYLSFVSDGNGGTDVYFNPHDGTNNGNPYLITDVVDVAPSSLSLSDVIFSTTSTSGGSGSSGSGSGGSTTGGGSTATSPGTTLTAPNNDGTTLTAGSGDYTLVASYGPDLLVGGSGPDIFDFPVIPWSAGKVENFIPGTDELDLASLFSAAGYSGSNPITDGYLSFVSDGDGGTDVYFNPHNGTNNGNPYLITDVVGVAPSSLGLSDVIFSSGSSSSGSGSSGSTATSPETTLTAPNNDGTTLTAGSGDYTLVASYGPDVLVGGSGPDIFDFPVIPWSAGKVENFIPGTDELDLASLFSAAGYSGSNPITDGYLSFVSDGNGGSDVYFSPHNGANNGNPYLITDVVGVAPSSLGLSDVIFSSGSSSSGSGPSGSTAASPETTLTAPNNDGTTLTAGSGDYTLVASYGPDVLVGGSGPDVFDFPVIPWSAGEVEHFIPGTDELDVSSLLSAAGYAGSNPIADGYLSLDSDGHGGTDVYFSPHNGTNNGNPYLITDVVGVSPTALSSLNNWLFHH